MKQTVQSKREELRWIIRKNELNKLFAQKRIFEQHLNECVIDLAHLAEELIYQPDESKLLCVLNEAILASKTRFSDILEQLQHSILFHRSQPIVLRILKLVNRAICEDDLAFTQIGNILEILLPYITDDISDDLLMIIFGLLTNLMKDDVSLISHSPHRTQFLESLCAQLTDNFDTGVPQSCIQFIHALATKSEIECTELVEMFLKVFSKTLAEVYPYETAISAYKIICISESNLIPIQTIPQFMKVFSYASLYILDEQVSYDYRFIRQYYAKFLVAFARSFIDQSNIEQAILIGILEMSLALLNIQGQMHIFGLKILVSLQKFKQDLLEEIVIFNGSNYLLKSIIIEDLAKQTQSGAVELILDLLKCYITECQGYIFECFMNVSDANIVIGYLHYFRNNFELLNLSHPVKIRLEQLTYEQNVHIAVLSANILTN